MLVMHNNARAEPDILTVVELLEVKDGSGRTGCVQCCCHEVVGTRGCRRSGDDLIA